MIKRLFINFLFLVTFFGLIQAQAVTLIYNPQTVIQPDTFYTNDTITYSFVVQSLDSNGINQGTVNYKQLLPPDTTEYLLHTAPLQLIGFDTSSVVFQEVVGAGKYSGGLNIIIIWPDAPNMVTDSIVKEIEYRDTTLNVPPGLAGNFEVKVFPKPSKGTVKVTTKAPAHLINDAVLYSPQGKLLCYFSELPKEMDLSYLPNGMYHFALRFTDGSAIREKLLIMK